MCKQPAKTFPGLGESSSSTSSSSRKRVSSLVDQRDSEKESKGTRSQQTGSGASRVSTARIPAVSVPERKRETERAPENRSRNLSPRKYKQENSRLPPHPSESLGYYSMREDQVEEVSIPRAPRLPQLDLDVLELPDGESTDNAVRELADTSRLTPTMAPPLSSRIGDGAKMLPIPQPRDAQEKRPLRSNTPPSVFQSKFVLDGAPSLGTDSQEASSTHGDRPTPTGRNRSSTVPPRVYFSPHVRHQANDWAETGSLSIPGCSSPRHARALQRALLLALLTEPGWDSIPQGMQQRAGWLFCKGWESSDGDGQGFRELDDLATVLSLPSGGESRLLLSSAISALIPEQSANKRPTSRPPTSPR